MGNEYTHEVHKNWANYKFFVKNFMKNVIVDLFNLDTKLVYRLDKEYPSFFV